MVTENADFPEERFAHYSRGTDGDPVPFIAQMRFHQTWSRVTVVSCEPGPNPHARGALFGSELTVADGRLGRDFLTPAFFDTVRHRFPPKRGPGVG